MQRSIFIFAVFLFTFFFMGAAHASTVNWAIGGSASQSSTRSYGGLTSLANNAIDGNTGGAWWGSPPDLLTHTNENHNPWWEVDLGSEKEIDSIDIWNRTDYEPGTSIWLGNRLFPFTVSVMDSDRNTLWSEIYSTEGSIQMSFDLPSTLIGQFVRIQHNGTQYLHLAEVQVWGDDGHGGNPVPVPGTLLLLGVGLIGLAGFNRRKK